MKREHISAFDDCRGNVGQVYLGDGSKLDRTGVSGTSRSRPMPMRSGTLEESGEAFDEEYGGWHFAVMCPGSRAWRDIFVANASNIVDNLSATAIYVDQVACSRAIPCFDPSHGHPLGGGSYWADGCREMLGRLHDTLAAKGVSISSEGAGEAYLGLVDGFDLASESHPDDVPFYTAVYGVYNGSSIGDSKDFPAFFASQARATVWGCVLETGWYCNWPLCEKDKRLSGAYAALAETRIVSFSVPFSGGATLPPYSVKVVSAP